MSTPQPKRRRWRPLAIALALTATAYGVYAVYRWAEPSPDALKQVMSAGSSSNVALRMERVTYDNVADGFRNWSLWAGRIDVLRTPGGYGQSTVQRADINELRDGKLYTLPSITPPDRGAPADRKDASPAATFSAREGRYTAGLLDPLPGDLQLIFNVQWQFRLFGDVHFRTREGDQLIAPELTILEMTHRRTGRTERRVLCGQGADITVKKITAHANALRYDPAERTVECTEGVRCTPRPGDVVQAEKAFWSLKDQMLRCPEAASGVWNGTAFTAHNLTLDTQRNDVQGNGLTLNLKSGRRP